MRIQKVSIFVLNYNGVLLLDECIPTILKSLKKTKFDTQFFLIDNRSTDESLSFMNTRFPEVPVLQAKENRFLCSFNDFVFQDHSDLVILMNNDIKVEEDFIDPIAEVFETKEDAFMGSSLCFDFTKVNYEGGLSVLTKRWGWWGTYSIQPEKSDDFSLTASVGACIAFRRDRFVELGGFDELYLPGTLEDLDICYRGWKRGWKGYFVKESVIYHKGQASFRAKFGRPKIREMATRNTLFFIWKNIHGTWFFAEHLICLGPRILYALLTADLSFVKGVFQAFLGLPLVWNKREQCKREGKVSDQKILEIFKPVDIK